MGLAGASGGLAGVAGEVAGSLLASFAGTPRRLVVVPSFFPRVRERARAKDRERERARERHRERQREKLWAPSRPGSLAGSACIL